MERRTQGEDLEFCDGESVLVGWVSLPSAFRVSSRALGNMYVRNGARGVERRVAHIEPMVVSAVSMIVAKAGENRAPARTF